MKAQMRSMTILSTAAAIVLTLGTARTLAGQMAQGAGNANAGATAYKRFCMGCHGPNGDGKGENAQWIDPKPRDFTEAIFKCRSTPTGTLPTDNDLFQTVTRGLVMTNMPSWRPLTTVTRENLVAYIKTFSPRWHTQTSGKPIMIPAETPVTTASILHGRQVFQKMECWKCHGSTGHGDGPSATALTDSKELPIHPHDFSEGMRFKCGTSNADLYQIFMTGVDGTPMPSFADQLQPTDAWDLVHFLRTLQPGRSPEGELWVPYQRVHASELPPIGATP
jgi:cytochrome c oxidase cbb3-type subunit 2